VEFIPEYGMFLAKALTVIITVAVIIGLSMGSGEKSDESMPKIIHLNEKLADLKHHFEQQVLTKQELKAKMKALKSEEKANSKKKDQPETERVYVLDFDGDIKASQAKQMKDQITALLSLDTPISEIVVKVESGGGMVHQYGFASSQLERIKAKGIPLTVCVDKVAASGGYMMAAVADKIVAAPFAVLGSIGVIAQVPNFSKVLKKNDIDFEVHTAGEYKRTLTMLGENTDKARDKFKQDLNEVHVLFKDFVVNHRPSVNVDEVANGDVWYGQKAIEVNLVDELKTSDEYLQARAETADVYLISQHKKKTLPQKLGMAAQVSVSKGIESALEKMSFQKWFF
jgi:serine protease SohB